MKEKIHLLSIYPDQFDHQRLVEYCSRENIAVGVEQALSFDQAAEVLSSRTPDLIITDFQVGQTPVFDSIDLLGDIPWIVLTGHGNENIAVQTLKCGAADYLVLDEEESYLPLLAESIRKLASQPSELADGNQDALARSEQLLKEETMQKERAQETLKESREIYRQFFQASSDAAFISSKDGRWIDMNQSALNMFGYEKREEIWKDSMMDVYWETEDQLSFTSLLEGQTSFQDQQVRFKRKDGAKIEALVSAAPYVLGGTVIGSQGFIRDVTSEIKARKVTETLNQLSLDLGTSLSPENIYQGMAIQIKRLFQPDVIQIHRIAGNQEINAAEFCWQTNSCPPELDLKTWSVEALSDTVRNTLLRNQRVVTFPGQNDDLAPEENSRPRDNGGDLPAGSTLIVPVVVEKQVIALIQLIDRDPHRYRPEDLDLAANMSNLVAIGLQKAYLYRESQLLVKKLTSLQRIERAVLENLSLPTTLDMLIDQLVKELEVDAGDILYLHPKLETLKFITQTGFRQNILQHTDLEVGEGLAGEAALSQEMVLVEDLRVTLDDYPRSLEFSTEHFQFYAGVPLLAKGRVVGVMELFHRKPFSPDQAWLDLLEMVAGLAAIAIDHQNLHNNLEGSRMEITQSLDAILEGWARALELRGIEPPGHWSRTVDLSLRLAGKLGITGDALVDIRRGALLHDIGKMAIPDQILHKGTKLSDEERKLIGRHPIEAFELVKPVKGLKSALDIPLYHHERWDGEGYPYQISGEEIPYQARIFAVVDVWDALLTDRPYRKAFTRDEALDHMRSQAGKHFDPAILGVFLEMLEEVGNEAVVGENGEDPHQQDPSQKPVTEPNQPTPVVVNTV